MVSCAAKEAALNQITIRHPAKESQPVCNPLAGRVDTVVSPFIALRRFLGFVRVMPMAAILSYVKMAT